MSETKDSPPTDNPFATMSVENLNKHLEYLDEVSKSNPELLSRLQRNYSAKVEEITPAQKKQLETYEKFMEAAQVKPVETDPSTDVKKIAAIGLDTMVDKIRGIDENFPVGDLLKSGLSDFDKIEALKAAATMAQYHQESIETLKKGIPEQAATSSEKFSAPADVQTNTTLIGRLKAYKVQE